MSLGGAVAGGGALAGSGGTLAAGGVTGTGGSTATSDGSATTDLDSCSSDADCLSSCIWITTPTSSNQCSASYCCGMTRLSKKRCDENQARWAYYCPNQSPTSQPCPCVGRCDHEIFGCVGGRCTVSCPPVADAASDGASISNHDGGTYCGDGVVNGTEECDDGILDGSYGGCTKQCKLAPHCGDGIVNGPEECDHGTDNDHDGICSRNCKCITGCML